MIDLRSMTGRELQWVRPAPFKRMYELRSGDTLVAEVRFEHPVGWTALARTGEGSWTFERSGFLRSKITVRNNDTSTEVANIPEKRSRRKQQVLLPDGSSYTLSSDFFRTRFTLETATGEPLAFVQRRGIFRVSWQTEIRYRSKSNPELPWLVMLLWFYILILRSRSRSRRVG